MGLFAAKQGDRATATDVHIVLVPSIAGPIPTPLPHFFSGEFNGGLSSNVRIMGRPAAMAGSSAQNAPPHLPMPPGTGFQIPPSNSGTIQGGSPTVRINGQPAGRQGDAVLTCNDPVNLPAGTVVAFGTVSIG
jgi:uncharacterized Zn-binding protein involved in type VI secretion